MASPSPWGSTLASGHRVTRNRPAMRKLPFSATEKDSDAEYKPSRKQLRQVDPNTPWTDARPKTKKEIDKTPSKIRRKASVPPSTPPLSSEQARGIRPRRSVPSPPAAELGSNSITCRHSGSLDTSPKVVKFETSLQASVPLLRPMPIKPQQTEECTKKQHQSETLCPSSAISKTRITASPFSSYTRSREQDTKNSSFQISHSFARASSPEKAVGQHGYHTEEEEKEVSDCFQQQEQMHLVSMLLIGPPHAGKSSLMRKLIGGVTEGSPLLSSELGSAICNSGPNPPSSEPHPLSSEPHPPSSESHSPSSEPHPPSSEPHPPSSEPHPPSSEPHPPSSEPHPPSSESYPPSSDNRVCTPCSELAETVLIKKVDSKLVMINGEGEWRVLNDPPCQADCCSSQLSSANILTGLKEVTRGSTSRNVVIFLNMIDVGSQPEFHETLSVLINGPAFPVIVFNATKSLKDQRTLIYQSNSDCNSNLYTTIMTTEDTLILSLSTIASSKQISTTVGKYLECSSPTILVGTNRRSSKDGKLSTREVDQLVSVELERDCPIVAVEKDMLVFEVDNKEDHDERFDQLRAFIEDIIRKQLKPFSMPHLWLALYSSLRRSKKPILQLSECQELAVDLGLLDLPKALEVFHNVGFIMHFPSCNELKDIVINDIQVVFDGTTALIKDTFSFENRALSRPLVDTFRKKGIFSLRDVERAYGVIPDSCQTLTASQLVALLQHRHVVVEISTKDRYFMPCVLPSVKLEPPSCKLLDSSSPSPLLVQLSCGYHSTAFTGNLIAQLISKWSLMDCACNRNMLIFIAGKSSDQVKLMCWPKYYEVWFIAQLVRVDSVKAACEQVCQELEDAILKVCELLGMNHRGVKHRLGFYCHCGDSSNTSPLHTVFFAEDRRESVITCGQTNRVLIDAELMWLHVEQPSFSPPFKEVTLVDFMNDVAAKIPALWRAVGIQLGLSTDALDGVQAAGASNLTAAYERVFALWSCLPALRTWDMVIMALRSSAVGKHCLADSLQQKYST